MRTLPLLSLPLLFCLVVPSGAQNTPPPVPTAPQVQVPASTDVTSPSVASPPVANPSVVSQDTASPDAARQDKDQEKTADATPKRDNDKPLAPSEIHNPTLWHDPGNIAQLDLFYGAGGKDKMPVPPFTFEDEDMNGTNPKFDARDANNRKWRVKVGPEARPEVAASRLLWAVGFYVNDDYVVPQADVENLKMKRKSDKIDGHHIVDARFARKPSKQKKIAIWEWKNNPFTGTREFNGLRVMMAVMNSWDLKDVNNAVYEDQKDGKQYFLISDIGATFASNNFRLPVASSKGDIKSFEKSKFIEKQNGDTVSFGTPKAPTGVLLKTFGLTTKEYAQRKGYDWIGNDIPVEDAVWMGSLLGQLSHQQLVDAFRAANFPPEEIDLYVTIIESRIARLKDL